MRLVLMMTALGLAGPVAGLSMQPDEPSNVRLVILAPWHNADSVVARAGGRILGPDRALFGALVEAPKPAQFDAAARALGAIWVRDGRAIATLCGLVP